MVCSPSSYALKFKKHFFSFRLPCEPYNARKPGVDIFSDQVEVQTHLMMGFGDVQAVRRSAQHSMAQPDQEKDIQTWFSAVWASKRV